MLDRLKGAWEEKCQPVPNTHTPSLFTECLLAACRPAQNLCGTEQASDPHMVLLQDLDFTLDIK